MTIVSSPVWRFSRLFSRIGLAVTLLLFVVGLTLTAFGVPSARALLAAGIVVLAAIPAFSVVVVCAENIRRRDWRFVAAATVVIALLVWGVVAKL